MIKLKSECFSALKSASVNHVYTPFYVRDNLVYVVTKYGYMSCKSDGDSSEPFKVNVDTVIGIPDEGSDVIISENKVEMICGGVPITFAVEGSSNYEVLPQKIVNESVSLPKRFSSVVRKRSSVLNEQYSKYITQSSQKYGDIGFAPEGILSTTGSFYCVDKMDLSELCKLYKVALGLVNGGESNFVESSEIIRLTLSSVFGKQLNSASYATFAGKQQKFYVVLGNEICEMYVERDPDKIVLNYGKFIRDREYVHDLRTEEISKLKKYLTRTKANNLLIMFERGGFLVFVVRNFDGNNDILTTNIPVGRQGYCAALSASNLMYSLATKDAKVYFSKVCCSFEHDDMLGIVAFLENDIDLETLDYTNAKKFIERKIEKSSDSIVAENKQVLTWF